MGFCRNRLAGEVAEALVFTMALIKLADGAPGLAELMIVIGLNNLSRTLLLLLAEQSQALLLSPLQQ